MFCYPLLLNFFVSLISFICSKAKCLKTALSPEVSKSLKFTSSKCMLLSRAWRRGGGVVKASL